MLLAGVLLVAVVAGAVQLTGVLAPDRPSAVVITVQNKYASGAEVLTEDQTPAFLSSLPVIGCRRRNCVVPGTDILWSGTLLTATCYTDGDLYTNADLDSPGIDRNPGAVTSTLWYFVRMPTGATGYLTEAYVIPQHRGGLGLPRCPTT